MKDLLARAYGVSFFQISSKQSLDVAYDVNLLIPAGTSKEQFQGMLRALLRERFKLKASLEKKDFPAFELVVAKSGSKLKQAAEGSSLTRLPEDFPKLPPGISTWQSQSKRVDGYIVVRLVAQQQPLSILAEVGSTFTPNQEPIVDHTGLTGKYNFWLEHTVDAPGAAPQSLSPGPSFFTALRESLGLELIGKKLPFDHLVVESFDRVPSEN
jgi:uncharacterized protein (TIGR03435 family)